MSKNINLLPKKKEPNIYQKKLLHVSNRIALISLILTTVSSLLLFILNINPALSKVVNDKNSTITNLSFTKGKVAKYLLVKDRVVGITKILNSRYPVSKLITIIQKQLPTDVAIYTMNVDHKNLALTLTSPSLSSLNTSIDHMTALLQSNKTLKNMMIQAISSDGKAQVYTVSLQAELL